MKYMIGSAALLLVLSTPAFAQEEPKPQQQEEHKPQDSPKAPAQEKAPPAKPDAGQPKEKQAPPEKPAQPPPKAQNQDKQQQNEKKAQEKSAQQQTKEQQAQPKQAQNHNPPAQNGGNERRIPDDKFRANFGSQHHFRVARGGGNRFQYGGYWFAYSEPWPVGWSYDDDCYIEDDGGVYYLIDVLHPDVRLVVAVEVS